MSVRHTHTLESRNDPPSWLRFGSSAGGMLPRLRETLSAAGITPGTVIKLTWQHEQTILKRKNLPKNTVHHQPSSPQTKPHSVVVLVVGDDPRNDLASVILSLPEAEAARLRAFLTRNPIWPPFPKPPSPPANAPQEPSAMANPAEPLPDDDTLALFLDALRENGCVVSRQTADSLAYRQFGGQTSLVDAAVERDFLTGSLDGTLYRITPAGTALLQRLLQPAPAPEGSAGTPVRSGSPATPSQFEVLRQSVQAARQQHEALQQAQNKHAAERTHLTGALTTARTEEAHAAKHLANCEERLLQARSTHESKRRELITLEQQALVLPDHAPALAQAQLALTTAEKAYHDFVAL